MGNVCEMHFKIQELREKIPSDENFFELGMLSEIDAFKYVQGTLHESGRGLAEKQAIAVALLVQVSGEITITKWWW